MVLKEILNKHTVKELKEMAKSFGIQGYSKLKKDELISFIEASLLNYEACKEIFLKADEDEMEMFKEALKTEVTMEDEQYYLYEYFFVHGYYYLSDEHKIIIPDEVRELYEKIFSGDFDKEKNRFDYIAEYCFACTNLYGIVPVEHVVSLFNEENEDRTCKEEVLEVYLKASERELLFYLEDGVFIHEAVESKEDLELLLEKQGEKPFYVPEKEELLCYADDAYFERGKAYEDVKAYIKKYLVPDETLAEAVADDIQLACAFGEGPQDALNVFLSREIEFQSEEQVYTVGKLISALNNETRMWENRGFTPNELKKLGLLGDDEMAEMPEIQRKKQETFVREGRKIGRNEKCPCGSGKKYKHCCGKNK